MAQEQPDAIAKEISRRADFHEKVARAHLQQFQDFEKLWLSIPEVKKGRPGKKRSDRFANTFVPESFRIVESVTTVLMSLMFDDLPWFELLPFDLTAEQIVGVFKTQAFLEQQHEDMDFEVKIENVIRTTVRDGTGIIETPFVFDSHFIATGDDENTAKEVFDYTGPDIIEQPMVGWGFYPFGRDMKTCPWVFKRERVHWSELERLIRGVQRMQSELNLEGMAELPEKEEVGEPPASETQNIKENLRTMQGWQDQTDEDGMVEVTDSWGEHPVKKDSPLVWRNVVVNMVKTVVDIVNPYDHGEAPFLRNIHLPRQRAFYGQGVGHGTWRKQKEINEFRNLGRDLQMFQLYNQWQREGGTGEQTDEFNLFPMKILDVSEHGRLTPLRPPIEALATMFQMENTDRDDMRHVGGATDPIQAVQGDPGSATEFRGTQTAAMRKLVRIAKQMSRRLLRPYIVRQMQLNKQFFKGSMLVRLFGKARMVDQAELVPMAKVKMRTATDVDFRDRMARRATSVLEMMIKVMQATKKNYNLDPVIAYAVKLMGVDPRVVIPELQKAAAMLPDMGPPGMSQDEILRTIGQQESQLDGKQTGVDVLAQLGLK